MKILSTAIINDKVYISFHALEAREFRRPLGNAEANIANTFLHWFMNILRKLNY